MALRWYIFFVNLGTLGLYLLAFELQAESMVVIMVAGLHLLTNLGLWLYFMITKGPREYVLGFRYSAVLGASLLIGPWIVLILLGLIGYVFSHI